MHGIQKRLARLYGEDRAGAMAARIDAMLAVHKGKKQPAHEWSESDALLITYADSILGQDVPPLQTLSRFLRAHVGKAISHVHLLPFYPFTSDDGFSVSDFRSVRPDLGTWEDVDSLAQDYHLAYDGVINHVSISSAYFQGFVSGDPRYNNFFIALDPDTDTSAVMRTRELPLLHDYDTSAGKQWIWTTFSRDQADLNYAEPEVLFEMLDVLMGYAARGASMLRLDAIPYLWKELGTSCIHLPQVHEIIKLIRDVMDIVSPGLQLLSETNVPHHENIAYFGDAGDEAQVIYNFTLSPLILHAILRGDASTLSEWARQVVPVSDRTTFLNVTATHDGIGMRPTEGILPEAEREMMAALAESRGAGIGGKRNADGSQSLYELNVTYFDALNDPAQGESTELQVARFMLSQTIAMSFLGMPGIYIHSLLGSRNDMEGFQRSGQRRSVNREQLSAEQLNSELASDTRRRAILEAYRNRLLQRASEPAFSPLAGQEILDMGPQVFALRRTHPATGRSVLALHNVTRENVVVCDNIRLAPYEAKWITADA
jgi:sucrose phosphorylase